MTHSSEIEKRLEQVLSNPPAPRLKDAMRYSLLSPGKRIRPRFVFAAGRMMDLPSELLWPTALALEIYHCSTLIHDDLPCMDNDDFRRGKPSNHKVYGEAMALLAGDGLLTLSFDVFSQSAALLEKDVLLKALHAYHNAIGVHGVIAGQALEFSREARSEKKGSVPTSESPDIHELKLIHDLKTGKLFYAAITIPGILAKLPEKQANTLQSYAHGVGRLFQVVDDVLDAEQDKAIGNPISILRTMKLDEALTLIQKEETRLNEILQTQWGTASADLQALTTEITSHVQKKSN